MMRKRKDIEEDIRKLSKSNKYPFIQESILEVLLDIRDLLENPKYTISGKPLDKETKFKVPRPVACAIKNCLIPNHYNLG